VTQRQRIDPEYKASRRVDDSFNALRAAITRALEHTRCELIRAPKGEADDAIATYVRAEPSRDIVILSEDRDLWQLVSSNVRVAATVRGKQTSIDPFACRRLLGVEPNRVANLKALLGDKSDNVPRAVPRLKKVLLSRLAAEAPPGDVAYIVSAPGATDSERDRIAGCKTRIETNLRLVSLWSDLDLIVTRGRPNRAAFLDEIESTDLDERDLALILGGPDEM
jgi:5'-3' exonuclease